MNFTKTLVVACVLLAVANTNPIPESRLAKRIPAAVYEAGQYAVPVQGTSIAVLDNGVEVDYQIGDGNLVVRAYGVPKWDTKVQTPPCTSPNWCTLAFQSDGNFFSYLNGVPTWASWTSGQGKWLVYFDIEPYIVIYNASYYPVWHTPLTPPPTAPMPTQWKEGGGGLPDFDVPIVVIDF